MGLRIERRRLRLTHFPCWGILIWMLTGSIIIPAGVLITKSDPIFGLVFILCGVGSFLGSFFLKRTTVIFDQDSNTVTRSWRSWIGIANREQVIPMNEAVAIVYEREYRQVASQGTRQRFSLYARTCEDEKFHFYPATYTPVNARELGEKLAEFLEVDFECRDTDRGERARQ